MYAGDNSRDCTAYHLDCGFNAWTLPSYMANPGFVMAYSSDQNGRRVAKMGLLLSEKDGGPSLTVDSIETYKTIANNKIDQGIAMEGIYNSIDQLQKWSDRNGWGDVTFCTYTNSTELTMELPVQKRPEGPVEQTALGGTLGLNELITNYHAHKQQVRDIGYIQAERKHGDDEDGEDGENNINHALQLTAQLVEQDILKLGSKDELIEAARSGDFAAFIRSYTISNTPGMYKLFGEQLVDRVSEGQFGFGRAIKLAKIEEAFAQICLNPISPKQAKQYMEFDIDYNNLSSNYSDATRHRFRLYELPEEYEKIETEYASLKQFMQLLMGEDKNPAFASQVLDFIYGNNATYTQEPADDDKEEELSFRQVPLKKQLPIVSRKILYDYLHPKNKIIN